MLSCREVTRLCSEEQERELRLNERLSVSMHNMMCRGCSNYRAQINFLRQATQRLVASAEDDAPGAAPDRPRKP